ncbi:MAG TPA: hypothetical protein VFQ61_30030 [Polyangiaceae bacterium]|nr:hypothetical protein [Polyangiaceae bacterium]
MSERSEGICRVDGDINITVEPPEEKVARVARQLKEIGRSATLAITLRIGRLIHQEIFAGKLQGALGSRARKTFRQLANHEETPFSMTALWRATALYEMSLRLPQAFELENLGISHYRSVLGLPEELQLELLTLAASEAWTKSELERQAQIARLHNRAVPRKSRVRLARSLDAIHERLLHWDCHLGAQEFGGDATRVLEGIQKIRSCCSRIEARLSTVAAATVEHGESRGGSQGGV